ncbi:hypothetical protein HJG60_009244 [Phyllostomus discolor]|uniref:Uncharacterized protein n=1 Tax=Phyllostomus discolor TaxID=89673 RepID=A0A833YFS3_9CHIR|nr:hypothetical protein HJG60_009244 [Phyllostomus discolor]
MICVEVDFFQHLISTVGGVEETTGEVDPGLGFVGQGRLGSDEVGHADNRRGSGGSQEKGGEARTEWKWDSPRSERIDVMGERKVQGGQATLARGRGAPVRGSGMWLEWTEMVMGLKVKFSQKVGRFGGKKQFL